MKRITALVTATLLVLPMFTQAAWLNGQGKPIPDAPDRRSNGDFGAHLVLTPSESEFRSTWNDSKSTPHLQSIQQIKPGQSLSGMFVFAGCQAGPEKVCNVEVVYSLTGPDGKTMPAGVGPFTLTADVTDKVAKRKVHLTSDFTLSK